MTTPTIVAKLQALLAQGITTEAEASYFLTEIRKLLEQEQAKDRYEYLTFHCDWAVHSTLKGRMTQKILKQFDAANVRLKAGLELHDLPNPLASEIDRVSKMRAFERELGMFMRAKGLRTLDETRADGWSHFLHLYGKIVEDSPLVMRPDDASATIVAVTLKLELAAKQDGEDTWFKVSWIIQDKNGLIGEIYVLNSFCSNPQGRHNALASQ